MILIGGRMTMFRNTISFIGNNFGFFAFVAVAYAVLDWAADASIPFALLVGLVLFVAGSVVDYLIYRRLLRRGALNPFRKGEAVDIRECIGFSLRSMALGTISIAGPTLLAFLTTTFSVTSVEAGIALIITSLLAAAVFEALTFAYLGTWLPAYLYGQNTEFSAALRRGRNSFGSLSFRFLVLNISIAALALLLPWLAGALAPDHVAWLDWLASGLFGNILGLVAEVYFAIALCQAYLTLEEIV
ncbi:hypothetical protein FF124_04740 [Martelella lutilitoris]|uniref:Uncharacterized protein n=1 Tax=Martelella lutilitoris TaxID=2583532 RepID=A0A5C4JV78_9HYPH|nr:hypothetical protein [Martelella lutilitoris]TNB49296.1 hypothetical protein FF124_04740 [Martelella lutilitoris]